MKYLINTTETYRVDTESEVEALIESAKRAGEYSLSKYGRQYKERKQKGETIEAYYLVSLVKQFNDIKEPGSSVEILYEVE